MYTNTHVLARWFGHFGPDATTKVEEWTTGVRIAFTDTPLGTDMDAFLADLEAPSKTFHQTNDVAAGSACWLDGMTAAFIGTDGLYVGGSAQDTTVRNYASPAQGTRVSLMPWATSKVLSLRTTRSRGRASNGRMYWPCGAPIISGSTGLMPTSECNNTAIAARVLLDAVNAAAGARFDAEAKICVMSNLGTGTTAIVTAVRVGTKPDHQESRERSLVETYSLQNLTSAAALISDRRKNVVGTLVDDVESRG